MRYQPLSIVVSPGVYPPSEDTYLLLDAIALFPNDTFLEVGCGAGLITLAAATIADRVIGTDTYIEAVRNTAQNARRNRLEHRCSVVQSDLLSEINASSRFSVIVFNPPYLPDDGMRTDLDYAVLGGAEGTELTVKFIEQAAIHLTKQGALYILTSSLADTEQVESVMKECGLTVKGVARKALFFEEIQVLKGMLKPLRKPFYDDRTEEAKPETWSS